MLKVRDYINIILSCVTLVVGVVGNALILLYFSTRTKHLREMSSYHFFIIQLALTDISVCIFVPLAEVHGTFYKESWHTGEFTCLWLSVIPYHVATGVSGWQLVTLSFDWYRKIVHPFKWQLNKRMVLLITIIIWGLSYCTVLPITLTFRYNASSETCFNKDTLLSEIYHSCVQSATIECLLPILSMSILYRKTSRKILSEGAEQLNRENYEYFEQRKKAVKTIKWLIILFTLTVLPGRIVHVIRSMWGFLDAGSIRHDVVLSVIEFMDKWIIVNSLINIFVYCKINKRFYEYLRDNFTRR